MDFYKLKSKPAFLLEYLGDYLVLTFSSLQQLPAFLGPWTHTWTSAANVTSLSLTLTLLPPFYKDPWD